MCAWNKQLCKTEKKFYFPKSLLFFLTWLIKELSTLWMEVIYFIRYSVYRLNIFFTASYRIFLILIDGFPYFLNLNAFKKSIDFYLFVLLQSYMITGAFLPSWTYFWSPGLWSWVWWQLLVTAGRRTAAQRGKDPGLQRWLPEWSETTWRRNLRSASASRGTLHTRLTGFFNEACKWTKVTILW